MDPSVQGAFSTDLSKAEYTPACQYDAVFPFCTAPREMLQICVKMQIVSSGKKGLLK